MYQVDLQIAEFPSQADQDVRDTTIGEILRIRAERTPDAMAVAVVSPGGEISRDSTVGLSYGQLLKRAHDVAASLLSRFSPGERVAIWAPNCIEWIEFEFGAALAGITFVTINPSAQARELRFILEQSNACGLFAVEQYRGNPIWEIARTVVAQMPAIRELARLDDLDALHHKGPPVMALPDVQPCDPAMILYTSGTTGAPKGVVLAHKGVTNNSRFLFGRLDPPARKPIVTSIPLFHVGGCVGALLGSIQHGCPLILLSLFDPALTLELVERHGAGTVTGVPTMIFALIEQQEKLHFDLSSLQRILCGGSLVAPELVRRARSVLGAGLQNIYGQTETSGVLTQTYLDDRIEDTAHTVGQPLPMTQISIRDIRTGAALPVSAVGEICARGYGIMQSYYQNPNATAAAFHSGGWLRTGDVGTMDSRGYVRVTGRVKEMIIRGGENIFPAEIENVLLEHPSVAEVAVVGLPDERWGEVVACFVRVASGKTFDERELIGYCRSQISAQKTPSRWVAVENWPMTGSGKIHKLALCDMMLTGEFD